MTKAELIHAIVAASARLGIEEPMTDGTNPELEAHLNTLSQRLADLEAEKGGTAELQTGGGTTQPDPKALDTGTAEPQTGGGTTQPDPKALDTGTAEPQTGGGTTQPDPKALDTGTVSPMTGGGTTQPDPKVMVQSSVTIETRRHDGTKLRLVADQATEITADDYALIKVLDYVKTV